MYYWWGYDKNKQATRRGKERGRGKRKLRFITKK